MSTVVFQAVEEAVEGEMERISKVLAGIPAGAEKAVGSALERAAQSGKTAGMKLVAQEYAIGQNKLKSYTKNVNTIVRDTSGRYTVTFGYRGNLIPLLEYDTKVNKNGVVESKVLRSSTRKTIESAFVAKMGAHKGVYERETTERFPVRELFGPSAVQAFYAREEVVDAMEDTVLANYEKRIDHEIMRVLNGWGV